MDNVKNIAVLGGSFLQNDFVETAKRKGHNVFVLDGNANCYLNNNPNCSFHHINFSNEKEVLKFCKEKNIDLVYAPSNELGNLISSKLASKVGFNFNSVETVQNTLSKAKQRELLAELKYIKSPKSIIFNDNVKWIDSNYIYPLIVKPSSSSASRGVLAVNNASELINAIDNAKQYLSSGDDIIIEEYIEGDQISVETITANNKHYIAGITKEVVSGPPYFIERSHFMGKKIHEKYYDLLIEAIDELLTVSNIDVGPCHVELKVNGSDIYLIEIASRAGGLRDRLMKISGYPDYNELIIDAYLKNRISKNLIQPPKLNSLVNILTEIDDLYSFVEGRKNEKLDSFYFNGNGPVPEPQNLIDAYGYAYFKSTESLKKYALK